MVAEKNHYSLTPQELNEAHSPWVSPKRFTCFKLQVLK